MNKNKKEEHTRTQNIEEMSREDAIIIKAKWFSTVFEEIYDMRKNVLL